jgi:HSP20 family protein
MTTEIQARKSRAEPWTDFDRLLEGLHQQFFDAFGMLPAEPGSLWTGGPAFAPALRPARADVIDTGKAYRIVAEIPGIPKENLDIRVRGNSVEIRGESAKETSKQEDSVLQRERTYAGYYRSLDLPEAVVASDAKAKVENGVLELELPKETPTPSPAEVKVAVQ